MGLLRLSSGLKGSSVTQDSDSGFCGGTIRIVCCLCQGQARGYGRITHFLPLPIIFKEPH